MSGWDLELSVKTVYETSAYLDKTDIRPNDVNDSEEVLAFGHINANAEIRFLALNGFEKRFRGRIGVLGCPLCVCLRVCHDGQK